MAHRAPFPWTKTGYQERNLRVSGPDSLQQHPSPGKCPWQGPIDGHFPGGWCEPVSFYAPLDPECVHRKIPISPGAVALRPARRGFHGHFPGRTRRYRRLTGNYGQIPGVAGQQCDVSGGQVRHSRNLSIGRHAGTWFTRNLSMFGANRKADPPLRWTVSGSHLSNWAHYRINALHLCTAFGNDSESVGHGWAGDRLQNP